MKKRNKALCIGMSVMLGISQIGCGNEDNSGTVTETEFIPEVIGIYEAEEAAGTGSVKAAASRALNGYSGTGYVEGFEQESDSLKFSVNIKENGFYDFNFKSASIGGGKDNFVCLDGESIGTVHVDSAEFTDSKLSRIYMEAGEHEITYAKSWGWVYLDCLEITTSAPLPSDIYEVKAKLSNKKASKEAKRLYSFLLDNYGQKFISGQFCDTGQYGKEFQVVKKVTGKTPAVLGLDFIEYTPSRVANGSKGHATEYAQDFWEDGGIVTFCWHWNAPEKYITGKWYSAFYTDSTNIDLGKIVSGQDKEGYELLDKDIDAIAEQLLILKEAKVPILWRPLHEASGGWFWWGASGPEAYKELYIHLYDRLTNEYGLDNLIWVWNGQDMDWYPGDEYVDIIGEDIYPGEKVYTSQADSYLNAALNYSEERKMVYLTENGCLFDPDLAKRDGAMWGLWCTWQGEFVAKDTNIFTLSEQYTEKSMMQKVYEHPDVITLEDLPDLKTYKIRKGL